MQPSYDSWDSGSSPWQADGGGSGAGGCEDPSAYGLVDISKGKGKGGGGGKGARDAWDSWEPSVNGSATPPPGSVEVPRPPPMSQPGDFSTGPGGFKGGGKGGSWRPSPPTPAPFAKGGDTSLVGKGGLCGKTPPPAGSGAFVPDPNSKGKPGFSYKGTLAPRKAPPPQTTPPSSVQVPPPTFAPGSKGACGAATQPGPGPVTVPAPMPARAQLPTLTPVAPQMLDGAARVPPRPATVAPPRLPVYRAESPRPVGVPPRLPLAGPGVMRPPSPAGSGVITIRAPGVTGPGLTPAAGLGAALATAAVSRSGAGTVMRPPPLSAQTRYVPPAQRQPPLGAQAGAPPPPLMPAPQHMLGQGLGVGLGRVVPALSNAPHTVLPQSGHAGPGPELPALIGAEGDNDLLKLGPLIPEKKPRIYLLVTRLAPELDEGHMQQIIEQCGEVQAFRRGRDADGKPLSFGFAQFGDPEAAWKASTCLSKRVLCGQEIKVLVEESAEGLIQQWRRSQQAALRVSTDEELDWELERKAVSCKASIDAKVEEIFGPPEDGSGGGAIAQRRQELRERENKRIERMKKRKAWREEEFSRELERIESAEKRLRREEVEKDDGDRAKEEAELRAQEEKEDSNLKLSRLEDVTPGSRAKASNHSNNRKLIDMVDVVQAEPRDELFRLELNIRFLHGEKVLEKKLRPWLERKVDLCMGGPQSDLVEHILRRVNGNAMPDTLISELTRYLDDNAEALVERMWRMLAFELMRGGEAFTNPLKKREGGQQQTS